MKKANLSFYASALSALVGGNSMISVSTIPTATMTTVNSPSNLVDTAGVSNTGVPNIQAINDIVFSMRQFEVINDNAAPNKWTRADKTRYKQLVVKWSVAPSDLSPEERNELETLEVRRTTSENVRPAEEVIAEFRTRKLYANLLASMRDVAAHQ
jgi:hypothetical protein